MEIIVVGGGVIGMACAWELARRGREVLLLEAGKLGGEAAMIGGPAGAGPIGSFAPSRSKLRRSSSSRAEARSCSSWAAAGILAPCLDPSRPAAWRSLIARSLELYPGWVAELRAASGLDPEYDVGGLIDCAPRGSLAQRQALAREQGREPERVAGKDLEALEPRLRAEGLEADYLPGVARIRPPRLLACLRAALAASHGIRVQEGQHAVARDLKAARVVWAAGAWSDAPGLSLPVRPVRGQIITVQAAPGTLGPVVSRGDHYALSRRDGLILLGSTMEEAGFDQAVTADGARSIADALRPLLPDLLALPPGPSWAGLRPATPDGLPLLGWHEELDGLLVATGHFRSGILLAPATAELVADLVDGARPAVDLAPFRPQRFSQTPAPVAETFA